MIKKIFKRKHAFHFTETLSIKENTIDLYQKKRLKLKKRKSSSQQKNFFELL